MFAHLTDMEYSNFQCANTTEKDDLAYTYMYDEKRGTYKCTAEFAHAVQTPWTLIVFNEINTLPTDVAKLLAPAFDHNREIHTGLGEVIKVHPTVLFAATRNPSRYIGTRPLPFEINNRAQTQLVGFPEFELEDGKYSSDEAETIAQYHGTCLLYTSPSPRDATLSRMPSSA